MPSVGQVYFWHHQILAPGATLAQFKVLVVGGAVTVPLGGFNPAPGASALGTTLGGIRVTYGSCKNVSFYMGSQFFQFISTPACSRLDVVADPARPSGQIETRDCTPSAAVVIPYQNGYGLTMNPNTSCQPIPGCLPVATSEKTWGQIKALYN